MMTSSTMRRAHLAGYLGVALILLLPEGALASRERQLDSTVFERLAQAGDRQRVEKLSLPDGSPVTAQLEQFEVFAPNAEIVVYGANDKVLTRLAPPDVKYFRGALAGEADSLVFLAVSSARVEGFIMRGERKYAISSRRISSKTRKPRVEVAIVESELADEMPADGKGFTCEVERAQISYRPGLDGVISGLSKDRIAANGALNTGTAQWVLNLAVETDYELFLNSGSSTSNVNTFIGNLMGATGTIYKRDLTTDIYVTYLGIHSSSSDPFTVVPGSSGTWNGSSTTYSAAHALAELGDRWANAGTRPFSGARSSTLLISGKSQLTGVAWVGTICEGDFLCGPSNCGSALFNTHYGGRYAYNGGIDPPGDLSVPNPDQNANYQAPASNYWPLLEVAHELGHNVGSSHTHCIALSAGDQVTYGRPYVDVCYSGECYSGSVSVPAEKGTIMSYCHLNGGGTQTRFTFGKNGEASYVVPPAMRSEIQSKTPTFSAGVSAPASLNAGASGTASISATGVSTYEWIVTNGTINSGQGTSSINFTATTNPVTVRVRATNTAGCSVTDYATVTVNAACTAPAISVHPVGSTIAAGQTAMLSVTATGTTPSYQWYTGTSGNTTSPVAGATSSTLSIAPGSTTSYWVRVSNGCGTADSNAATVTVTPPTATQFYTLTPCRIIDTRDATGPFGGPILGGNLTRTVAAGGTCGIPVDAKALSVNITVVPGAAAGHLTVYPAGSAPPLASTINFSNRVRANNARVQVSNDGTASFSVFNGASDGAHFIVDVNGYFK